MLEVAIARKDITSAAGDRLEVLTDLAFTLRDGEVGVLVGPSGCGKTTLLRIIAGLDRDFSGRIALPPRSRIGMVFQEPRLLPWRSVDDNVRLAAPNADEATLAALFATLELTTHRSHFPGELSLGLARRVALARAFAIKPDVLILDEPLVSLDAALAARLRDEIATLVDSRPVTTLLVTHDVDDAVRLADRIFLLSPRPARMIAELPIDTPRAARSAAEIAAISTEIARLNGADGRTDGQNHKNSNDKFKCVIASGAKQSRTSP
jgi:NitT/TauT family transport system ATP-binding protein